MSEPATIWLKRKNGDLVKVTIDLADAPLVVGRDWRIHPRGVFCDADNVLLKSLIMGTSKPVYFINGDKLDHRRQNLSLFRGAQDDQTRGGCIIAYRGDVIAMVRRFGYSAVRSFSERVHGAKEARVKAEAARLKLLKLAEKASSASTFRALNEASIVAEKHGLDFAVYLEGYMARAMERAGLELIERYRGLSHFDKRHGHSPMLQVIDEEDERGESYAGCAVDRFDGSFAQFAGGG